MNTTYQNTLGRLIALLFLAGGSATALGGDMSESCDSQRGEVIYQKCATCHPITDDGQHGAGPNLFGILNQDIGKKPGYKYSKALRKTDGQWTEETLHTFLNNPMQTYPGTSMGFSGLKQQRDRDDVICFLYLQQ